MTPDADTKAEIARLDERIEALKREMCLSEAHSQAALRIAADEIARRLHDLNGEAERLRQMQATYLPRETFEIHIGRQDRIITALALLVLAGVISAVVRLFT